MNELTNKEIEDYLSSLPNSVLTVIQDKNWKKRLIEISAKYSLSEEQSIKLQNLVLFVIIAVENPDDFAQSVKNELNISNLLAEQIIKDVDERIFQYVINIISEEKNNHVEEKPITVVQNKEEPVAKEPHTDFDVLRTMSKDIEYIKNGQDPVLHNPVPKDEPKIESSEKFVENKIPEIKPNILPEIKQEVREKVDTTPHNLPGMEIGETKKEEVLPEVKIDDLGDNKVFMGSEFIQKTQEINSVPQNKPILEKQKPQTVTPPPPVEKKIDVSVPKYTVDPYREPLE